MSTWTTYRLGDLCTDVSYGYTQSANETKVGPKFLRITDIREGAINWKTVPYCIINQKDYLKYKLEHGDIVVARTGATTGITETIKSTVDAVFASYLIRFRVNKYLADPIFVGYTLKSNYWREYVGSIVGGSAQPGANAKQFSDFVINLPDLPTQKTIAEILSSLDDKVELNNEMNKTLEELAQTLFKRWFVDFEFPDENGNPYQSSGGEMVESELGLIPKGWSIGELGDFAAISKDSTNPQKNPLTQYRHYSLPAFDNKMSPSIEVGESILSNKFTLTQQSVLISKLNPRIPRVWRVTNLKRNSICSTEFVVLNSYKKVFFDYIYCLVKSKDYSDYLIGLASGTSGSHQRVKPKDFLEYKSILPSEKVVVEFSNTVGDALQKLSSNLEEQLYLTEVRNLLLPKLMSGQIEV
jgi:type I restriction enzyme S subunit